jgi:hypothetical protein
MIYWKALIAPLEYPVLIASVCDCNITLQIIDFHSFLRIHSLAGPRTLEGTVCSDEMLKDVL